MNYKILAGISGILFLGLGAYTGINGDYISVGIAVVGLIISALMLLLNSKVKILKMTTLYTTKLKKYY